MKVTQDIPPKAFVPVVIVLETKEDCSRMLGCMATAATSCNLPENRQFAHSVGLQIAGKQ